MDHKLVLENSGSAVVYTLPNNIIINISRFKLFLHRGIKKVHEFSCMSNVVCVHVTYTVATVHVICEGLWKRMLLLGLHPANEYWEML